MYESDGWCNSNWSDMRLILSDEYDYVPDGICFANLAAYASFATLGLLVSARRGGARFFAIPATTNFFF
jgi:hypothetical protein